MKFVMLIIFALFSGQCVAEDGEVKYYPFKCYMTYFGGGDGIHAYSTKVNDVNQAYRFFDGKKLKPSFHGNTRIKGERKVYKVKECVESSKSFTLGRAQHLERTLIQ